MSPSKTKCSSFNLLFYRASFMVLAPGPTLMEKLSSRSTVATTICVDLRSKDTSKAMPLDCTTTGSGPLSRPQRSVRGSTLFDLATLPPLCELALKKPGRWSMRRASGWSWYEPPCHGCTSSTVREMTRVAGNLSGQDGAHSSAKSQTSGRGCSGRRCKTTCAGKSLRKDGNIAEGCWRSVCWGQEPSCR